MILKGLALKYCKSEKNRERAEESQESSSSVPKAPPAPAASSSSNQNSSVRAGSRTKPLTRYLGAKVGSNHDGGHHSFSILRDLMGSTN